MQPNGRHFVWNGSRVNLSHWTRSSAQDAVSLVSTPPQLDGDAHVASTNLGRSRGQNLGHARDYSGTPVARLF
jgi:hypothetical protein